MNDAAGTWAILKHPNVVCARINLRVEMPDQTIKRILVVDTNLPLLESQDGYNSEKLDEFVELVSSAVWIGFSPL